MLLGCVGLLGFGAKTAADSLEELDANQKGANAVTAQMNKPATDGDLQFTVTAVKCDVASVGSDPKELWSRFGDVEYALNGDCLEVPASQETEVVSILHEHDYKVTRDDELIQILDGGTFLS